ncbi:dihydroorotate dehydrogenase [Pelomyxa schiedti]|nr:dihydroorotate dehydrogenase [Pelomyxa schiedti]
MASTTHNPLAVNIAGLDFKNPFFVAAGPPGRDAKCLVACANGGSGGLVCKTISTSAAQVPRPCMARPASDLATSMLNVELWSDLPPEDWIAREYAAARVPGVPLIASVGYSAADMLALVPKVDPLVDAFEFSCHYTKLDEITALAQALRKSTTKPIFAKLSPHGHDLIELAKQLRSCGINGFVVMNSLGPCLSLDIETERPLLGGSGGKGWMSGSAIRPIALYWVSQLVTAMPDVPVIGVGGVTSWRDAVEFFLAGASGVQVCTAAIYQGPKVFGDLVTGVTSFLQRKGYSSVTQLRGRALAHLPVQHNLIPPISSVNDTCVHCGVCQRGCPFEAILVKKGDATSPASWKVDPTKCYGCGLCTTLCPKHSLSMITRS